jgi:ATP-dependent DNA helicase PIF1
MDIRTFFAKGKGPKFYGVQAGHKPGVYETWEEAEEQIKGFRGACHRSFPTKEEAQDFVDQPPLPEIYQPTESKPTDSQLNTEQRAAFDAVVDGKSIFITGPGGTGKSFLLENLHDYFKLRSKRKLAITAMTGCAAVLIGPFAKTLHSWAGIGLGRGDPEKIAEAVATDKRKGPRWRKTDCLVIDEVSMMTPGLLELLDVVGRRARKCPDRPFGGIQMVFVGDFYQLPPVGSGGFAFDSPLWSRVVKDTFFLTEIVRQKDPIFQQILNEARIGELSAESYEILESRKTMDWKRKEIKPTLLFTKNNDVNEINDGQMRKLPGEERVFTAETHVPPGMTRDIAQMLVEKLDKDAPYEVELRLKERAQVMLLKQHYEEKEDKDGKKTLSPVHGLVNGSRGIVTGFSADGYPIVKFLNGRTITVRPATWSSDDEPNSLKREQIPLRVAYALTIHKAQGASLDSALVDVGPSTFECGQAYVALSRVRSLEALYIFEISKRAFRANPAVKAFYGALRTKIEEPVSHN